MYTLTIISVSKGILTYTHSEELVATLHFQNLNLFLKFLINLPHTTRIVGLEKIRSNYYPISVFQNGKPCETRTVRRLYLNYSPEQIARTTGIPVKNVKQIISKLNKTQKKVRRYQS